MAATYDDELAVAQALLTIMSGSATEQARSQAHQIVENFKNLSANRFGIASRFYTQPTLFCTELSSVCSLRHFALHVLEQYVRTQWNSISVSEQQSIHKLVLALLVPNAEVAVMVSQFGFLKEKLVSLVVEVVKRDWPQRWPSLLTDLNEIYHQDTSNVLQMELVLLLLRSLFEGAEELTCTRRKDVSQGLKDAAPALAQFLVQTLEQAVPDPSVIVKQHHLYRVVVAALSAAGAMAPWVLMEVIEESRIVLACCRFLCASDVSPLACEAVLAFVEKKQLHGHSAVFDQVWQCLPNIQVLLGMVVSEVEASVPVEVNEESYLLLRRLCQIVVELGGEQMCSLASHGKLKFPDAFSHYLQLLFQIFELSSDMVRMMAMSTWMTLARNPVIGVHTEFVAYMRNVFQFCVNRMLLVPDPIQVKRSNCFLAVDFDSNTERGIFLGAMRSVYQDMARIAVQHVPDDCAEMIAQHIMSYGFEGAEGNTVLEHALTFLSVVTSGLCGTAKHQYAVSEPSAPELSPRANQALSQATNHLLLTVQQQTAALRLHPVQIDLIGIAMIHYLAVDSTYLLAIMDVIFSALLQYRSASTESPSTLEHRLVRRSICCNLIRICDRLAPLLLPSFNQLLQYVTTVVAGAEGSYFQKGSLYEALVLVTNAAATFPEQQQFIESIAQPSLAEWLDIDFAASFSTSQALANRLELLHQTNSPTPSFSPTSTAFRAKLLGVCSVISGIIKRARPPVSTDAQVSGGFVFEDGVHNPALTVVPQYFPNLLKLTRAAHELLSTNGRSIVCPAVYPALYELSESETLLVLGRSAPPKNRGANALLDLRTFLLRLRDHMYTGLTVSFSAWPQMFSSPENIQMIGEPLFSEVERMDMSLLETLLHQTVRPLIKVCPTSSFPALCQLVLFPLFERIHQLLNQLWAAYTHKNPTIPLDGVLDPDEEETACGAEENAGSVDHQSAEVVAVVKQRLLSKLSREYLSVLCCLLNGEASTSESKDTVNLRAGLALDENLATLLRYLIECCLWRDSALCHRATKILCALLAAVMVDSNFHALIGTHIFATAIQSLSIHGHITECQSDIILLIWKIYTFYASLPVHHPRQILLQLPNATPTGITNFETELSNLNEKNQRDLFKKCLQDFTGVSLSELHKDPRSVILPLPEVMMKQQAKERHEAEDESLHDVASLFNTDRNDALDF